MRDERGRFLPGPDKDRHVLTREERVRGYRTAVASYQGYHPDGRPRSLWLLWRVKDHALAIARAYPCPDDFREVKR